MLKNKRAFTLIELLVVIGIVAILAAVVFAALNGGRGKGSDASIKAQLVSMRNQAELYTGGGTAVSASACVTNNSSTLFYTGNNGLGNLILGLPSGANARCASATGRPSEGASWAVAAKLSTTEAWCVDSTGASRIESSVISAITGTACNP